MANTVLADLAVALASGAIKVVDLSVTLSADTPILELPEEFGWGKSWPFSKEEISRYDDRGPAWYWNNIKCGEHTGTHFDAPIHWVTGQDLPDNATDTLPPERFVGPAIVIDAVAEAAADPDFLMSVDFVKSWEAQHGQIPDGAWVLYRTDWSKKESKEAYLNKDETGGHTPGWDPETVSFLAQERNIIGVGVETVGTDSGQAAGQGFRRINMTLTGCQMKPAMMRCIISVSSQITVLVCSFWNLMITGWVRPFTLLTGPALRSNLAIILVSLRQDMRCIISPFWGA